MRKSNKKELILSFEFYDKVTGEYLGNDPVEVFPKLPLARQAQMKALCMEIKTGDQYKAI